MLDRFLDWFKAPLTSRKCAANAKYSADSALSDMNDLIPQYVFCKNPPGGRFLAKYWQRWLSPYNCGLLNGVGVISGDIVMVVERTRSCCCVCHKPR